MLTKSDFLLYLDAPLHLWAKKNRKLTKTTPSIYEQHLMQQGYIVEKLAHKLLPNASWQKPYFTKDFEIRQDALIKYPDGTGHLYEVKSSTEVKKEHLYDLAFQLLVSKEKIKLTKIFTVTLNKDYVLKGKLDIKSLFIVTDVTHKVKALKPVVEEKMYDALNVANKKKKDYITNCLNPKTCPCIDLCHPNLLKKSIFNIPYLSYQKKRELVDSKIIDINKLPINYSLNPMQKKIAESLKLNKPYLDRPKLKEFLDSFTHPIYFLDYETYPLAIPIYDNYKTYQQIVFQYSLHIVNKDNNITHREYLETKKEDPAKNLIKNLSKDIGNLGTVVSWNKQFEMGRNEELIKLHPEYKEFLEGVNKRMVDLADFINKEMYIHPEFLGSWSIKNVLPVMVPDLSYKNLKINKGDQAMISWWEMVNGKKDKKIQKNLLEYCKLDTLAMIKIWEKLNTLLF